jgi:hypothetical protein
MPIPPVPDQAHPQGVWHDEMLPLALIITGDKKNVSRKMLNNSQPNVLTF